MLSGQKLSVTSYFRELYGESGYISKIPDGQLDSGRRLAHANNVGVNACSTDTHNAELWFLDDATFKIDTSPLLLFLLFPPLPLPLPLPHN